MAPLPSWLDHISPCEDVYVYQASLLCSDCAEAIIKDLEKEGQIDTGDSESWPQGPHGNGGGEADSPQHCDMGKRCKNSIPVPNGNEIGCPLGNPLTSDGNTYVLETIVKNILSADTHRRAVGRLWHHLYNYIKTDKLIKIPAPYDDTFKLRQALVWLSEQDHTKLVNEFYTDLDHIYGAAFSPSGEKVTLWRLEITAKGGFTGLSVVSLQGTERKARTVEDMIDEAYAEDAWE
jgi:hypothetical protein